MHPAALPESEPMSDDTPNDDNKVVRVAFGTETRIVRDRERVCRHLQYELELDTRVARCQCGAQLDTFQILLEYARAERHWRHYATEEREIRERLAALAAEERRIKARIRNARRRDPESALEEHRKRSAARDRTIAWNAREIEEMAARIRKLMERALPANDNAEPIGPPQLPTPPETSKETPKP